MVHSIFTGILTIFYPLVPTGVFLTVLWHKYMYETPATEEENAIEDATQKSDRTQNKKRIRTLVHWARMAPIIEGGIEAPMQFLLQVNINLPTYLLEGVRLSWGT